MLACGACSDMATSVTKLRVHITSPESGAEVLSGGSFFFTASVKGGLPPHDVSWDFGGGAPAFSGQNPGVVTFATEGAFVVRCNVTDSWNNTAHATIVVSVQAMIAEIVSPPDGTTLDVGDSADFQGDVQGGTAPLTYAWDFNGQAPASTVEDPGNVAFNNVGTYTVTFTVTDAASNTDSDTVSVTVIDPSFVRTKDDIKAYWNAIKPSLSSCSYSQDPVYAVDDTGFEGVLTQTLNDEGVAWMNFYRWLAGLPDTVAEDAVWRVRCQKGAHVLVMLNSTGPTYTSPHDPPVPTGASALYTANIYGGPATVAGNTGGWVAAASSNIYRGWGGAAYTPARTVDGYMVDTGNDSTLGHRRWILYPRLSETAFGTVWNAGYWASCHYVLERPSFTAPTPSYDWVAWPSPGFYPLQCFTGSTALWSFSANSADWDLDGTTWVTVVRDSDSQDLGVSTDVKTPGYGITPTIGFNPGEANKDETYHVTVHDILDKASSTRFDHSYSVTFFDLNE